MVVLRPRRRLLNFFSHQVANFLIAEAVPYTIASVDNEFIIARTIDHLDVGIGGHSLILPVELLIILVLIIAEGSAQGQVTVDTLVADKMACLLNATVL